MHQFRAWHTVNTGFVVTVLLLSWSITAPSVEDHLCLTTLLSSPGMPFSLLFSLCLLLFHQIPALSSACRPLSPTPSFTLAFPCFGVFVHTSIWITVLHYCLYLEFLFSDRDQLSVYLCPGITCHALQLVGFFQSVNLMLSSRLSHLIPSDTLC